MYEKALFDLARYTYGIEAQMDMCIEEMSELTKELCKQKRGKENSDQVAEEIADVAIMLDQMIQFFGISEQVEDYRAAKLDRLFDRLSDQI